MRKLLAVAAVAVVLVAFTGCQPSEPAMTITAGLEDPACLNNSIVGKVSPPSASKTVVLQRTVNGKWVDWKWYVGSETTARVIKEIVYQDDGDYQLGYEPEKPDGTPLRGTIHLRARSEKGTAFSNGVYVTHPKVC